MLEKKNPPFYLTSLASLAPVLEWGCVQTRVSLGCAIFSPILFILQTHFQTCGVVCGSKKMCPLMKSREAISDTPTDELLSTFSSYWLSSNLHWHFYKRQLCFQRLTKLWWTPRSQHRCRKWAVWLVSWVKQIQMSVVQTMSGVHLFFKKS